MLFPNVSKIVTNNNALNNEKFKEKEIIWKKFMSDNKYACTYSENNIKF